MESSLISEFTNTCGHGLEASNIAFSQSCFVEGGSFEKLTDIHSVQVNNGAISILLKNKAPEKVKEVTIFRFYCSGYVHHSYYLLVCVYMDPVSVYTGRINSFHPSCVTELSAIKDH